MFRFLGVAIATLVTPTFGRTHYGNEGFAYLDTLAGQCEVLDFSNGGGAACALGQVLQGEPGVGLVRYKAGTVFQECQQNTPKYCCPADVAIGSIPGEVSQCRQLETPGGIGPCTCGESSMSGGWSYYDRRPAVTGGETVVICCDE